MYLAVWEAVWELAVCSSPSTAVGVGAGVAPRTRAPAPAPGTRPATSPGSPGTRAPAPGSPGTPGVGVGAHHPGGQDLLLALLLGILPGRHHGTDLRDLRDGLEM